MMEKDGMRFAGVRPPQKNYIRFFDLLVGVRSPAGPENHRQTGDAGGMSSPVAAIDVVASHHDASELLRNEIHFVRRFRATEHAERPASRLSQRAFETTCRPVQSFVPSGRAQRP